MISGGDEIKCTRLVHQVGREPQEVARPCTPQEKAEQKATAEKTKPAQKQLSQMEMERWRQYYKLQEQCEKRFGSTACNR